MGKHKNTQEAQEEVQGVGSRRFPTECDLLINNYHSSSSFYYSVVFFLNTLFNLSFHPFSVNFLSIDFPIYHIFCSA